MQIPFPSLSPMIENKLITHGATTGRRASGRAGGFKRVVLNARRTTRREKGLGTCLALAAASRKKTTEADICCTSAFVYLVVRIFFSRSK